jgi:5-methyltetrahydrofolate--homocysteine methyltransferase
MRPHVEEMARLAPCFTAAYPNAGLPDPLSATGFPETPESMAPKLREWAENGWLNMVGGCCGTTPEHIRAIAQAVREFPPRIPVIPNEVEGSRKETGQPATPLQPEVAILA